jgi:hypothetical protein
VLTEAHGSWTSSPTSFGYRWEVCDRSGGSCSTISRATSRKYKLTASDLGHTIRVDESAGNADGPGGTATSAHTAVVIPSSAQIKASLLHAITPHGRAARIVELVRKRRYALSLKAITAGRVVIEWYYLPRGAHLASGKAKPQAVLVAVGKATFSRAGTSKVMIKLSVRGTRLLKQAKRLRLTALGTFTPATRHAVTATKRFTLLR